MGMVRRYKIADVVLDAEFIYAYTTHVCKDYIYNGDEQPAFFIKMTKQDIDEELKKAGEFEEPYLESLAFYRKLLQKLIDLDGIVFHCSALAVDDKGYLFTAPSGTGKSTHASLWRKLLGDKVVMVNDDKPIIRKVNGEFFVYGTPWTGKHELGNNVKAKIQGICKLERGEENKIESISFSQILPTLMTQTLRPETEQELDKLLKILSELATSVKAYRLQCNMDISAAKLAYEMMR